MARGDAAKPGTRGRGTSLLGCVFVFVLAAGVITLWTTQAIQHFFAHGGPMGWIYPAPPPDPFAVQNAALHAVIWRDSEVAAMGPTVGPASPASPATSVDTRLHARGYVPDASNWSDSIPLPYDGLAPLAAGGCGLVALVTETSPSSLSRARATHMQTITVSGVGNTIFVAACGGDTMHVEGAGQTRMRGFAAPGLTPELLAEIGAPLDVVLAQAEAAALLAPRGFVPDDRLVRAGVASTRPPTGTPVYRSATVTVPGLPTHGCVPFVAVGYGVTASMTQVSDRFMSGQIACASPVTGTSDTLSVDDIAGDGGEVWFRAYHAMPVGPTVPTTAAALDFGMHTTPARGYHATAVLDEPAAP